MRLHALLGRRPRALTLALALVVFAVDVATPLHSSHALLYIPVVLVTLWSPRRRDPLLAGALCTLLAVGACAWAPTPDAGEPRMLVEHGLSLLALWVTTVGVHTRLLADSRLRDREERLRLMADALPVLISYIGPDLRYRYTNSRYRDWFGIEPASLVGRPVVELVGDAAWSRLEPFLRRALAGEQLAFEGPLRYADGRERVIHVDFVPHRDEAGAVLGTYAMSADVSERERVERELREGEAALRAVLDSAIDGIVTVRARGTLTTFNRAAERLFGWSADEAIGHDLRLLFDLPPGEDGDDPLAALFDQAGAAGGSVGVELEGRRRDGTSFPVEVGLGAWRDGEMHTLVLRDITERRELQAEVQQSQRLEAVGRFAGAIAHDFNNLLMGILGCCRIAARGVPEDSVQRAQLDEIRAAAERGAGLTRQLLAFSRKKDVESASVCLDEVVRGTEALMRSLVGEEVELALELDADGSAVVAAPGQLEQVLLNLVSNARDAISGCGRLTIRTHLCTCVEPDGDTSLRHVALEVADTGCGMDAETRARALEPFYTTKPVAEGTGLGLSTVYGIVRQIGGHLHLESEPGAGTTIRIHLPPGEVPPAALAPQDASAAPPPPARAPAPEPRGGETILVVEDDRLVRAGLRHLLEEEGYRVLLAADGDAALRVCDEHAGELDLLLTDIIMPGMSGAELAQRLGERQPRLTALFMSALPGDVLVEQGRLEPGKETIQKPFDEAELLERLRRLLAAGASG